MSATSPFLFGSTGVAAFLVTAAIGWNLATPSATPVRPKEAVPLATKHVSRRQPSPRAVAADVAARRVATVRSAGNTAARMRATIDLANSLAPADFAAWLDGGWFTLSNGPEMKLFSEILMKRWQQEDPEGCLAWRLKHGEGKETELEWAAKDPQRLLAFFKTHKDDSEELKMLGKIAVHSPDLAIQRLCEMAAAGLREDAMRSSEELLEVLAKKSPETLSAALDSLPAHLRTEASVAISKERLASGFSDEIHHLSELPDGWEVFSRCISQTKKFRETLLDELENMPPQWRAKLSGMSYNWISAGSAPRWWDANLEGAGFSAAEARSIRLQALNRMSDSNPELTLQKMGEIDLTPSERELPLAELFRSVRDLKKARTWVAGLPTEEERTAATAILDERSKPAKPAENFANLTPDEYLAKLAAGTVPQDGPGASYSQGLALDSTKLSSLGAGFKELPDNQKQTVAAALISFQNDLPWQDPLRGNAIRYLVEHPLPAAPAGSEWEGVTAASSFYAINLSRGNPAAATDWVKTLPDGEAKIWAQKNLAVNWAQYDPKAVDQWMQTLPADSRADVKEHLKQKGRLYKSP